MNTIDDFVEILRNAINNGTFVKLTISSKQNKTDDVNAVYARLVQLKSGLNLSFVYRYVNKDVTKNYLVDDALAEIKKLISEKYKQADLFTTTFDFHLLRSKNCAINIKKKQATTTASANLNHDNEKQRFINADNNVYLQELGVVSQDGKIKKNMTDKFRQINKYVEIIDNILKNEKLNSDFSIVDMGSGKGYLTFALYDYLQNNLKIDAKITGVELRPELVEFCNNLARKVNFSNLNFISGAIENSNLPKSDMIIALHACNTATDDAIYRGIKSNAKFIICAPCCYKQIRPQINTANALNEITKHGILCERQAEIVTDAIRAAILEAYGYKTKVFEFIETEHTPKNVLIVGKFTNKFPNPMQKS